MTRLESVLVVHDVGHAAGMDAACRALLVNRILPGKVTVISTTLADDVRPYVDQWIRIPAPRRPFALKFMVFGVLASVVAMRKKRAFVITVGAIAACRADVFLVFHCHAGQRRAVGALFHRSQSLMRKISTGTARRIALTAESALYGRSDAVAIVSSTALEQELTEFYPRLRCFVAPNGADAPASSDARVGANNRASALRTARFAGRVREPTVLLFLGGDWHRKGLPRLLEAIALVPKEILLELWIVGRGDAVEAWRWVSRLGIEERVSILGPVRTVQEYYAAADIFALASYYETFSLPAFEAAWEGVPVLSTSVHGVSELVRNGGGLLVGPSASEIADGIILLASSPRLRAALGRKGSEFARRFTWLAYCEAVSAAFEMVAT